MKGHLEDAANAPSFRGKALLVHIISALPEHPDLDRAYQALRSAWNAASTGAYVFLGMVRWSFFIELVKAPKIETTKFEVRWAQRLGAGDPRYATYDECLEMFLLLAQEAIQAAADPVRNELLETFAERRLVPYELPLDYRTRGGGRLHVPGNVTWLWGNEPRKTVLLRDYLLGNDVGAHLVTFAAAYEKTRVKTYLTDRVLTGAHKTNREKRWETHPESVHFALRRDCLEIEHTLMEQLCAFSGFPDDIRDQLRLRNLVNVTGESFRCPVTLEPLSFEEFEAEIINPIQGKSSFQVGHLNPLKATNDDPRSGHTALNVSWVSANGNRIQGSLSLDATRAMIQRIAENYARLGTGYVE